MYVYIGFKTSFYVVRHPDSIVSYLPTGLHLGFFRSWPSLYLPSSLSSIFLDLLEMPNEICQTEQFLCLRCTLKVTNLGNDYLLQFCSSCRL